MQPEIPYPWKGHGPEIPYPLWTEGHTPVKTLPFRTFVGKRYGDQILKLMTMLHVICL